jgi:hypothetical protein
MENFEIESDGRRRKVEPMDLVETMLILQSEVYINREYNERMIKSE